MNILIIEDENLAAKRLSKLVQDIDDQIQIMDIIDSIEQGLDWFDTHAMPDLIFADIELADGMSFEIFRQLDVTCPIIFCTAYNQYMVEAFETNAVSYILKPITREQVEKALEQYYAMKKVFDLAPQKTMSYNSDIEHLLSSLSEKTNQYKSTLLVNYRERIIPINVDDIAYIYATSSGMVITMNNGDEYSYISTLDKLSQILNPQHFYHANRQFIISRKSIKSIERYFNRKLLVKLVFKTPEQILISRLKSKEFLEWIEE